MPQSIQDALARYHAAQTDMPAPDRIGRSIGLKR
jgi:hypothetical protein